MMCDVTFNDNSAIVLSTKSINEITTFIKTEHCSYNDTDIQSLSS